jgi:hypothetical protein
MWWVFIGIALLMLVWSNREHMTNEDLLAGLKQMGTHNPTVKDSDQPKEAPIYGPRVPKLEHPDPNPAETSETGAGLYPQIYGPDVPMVPGNKKTSKTGTGAIGGSQASDVVNSPVHEFNPDLKRSFPTNGEPEPYLNDFSRIQK